MSTNTDAQNPNIDGYEDGVDLTLIRWMLSLTAEERLRALENCIWSLLRLKRGTFQA